MNTKFVGTKELRQNMAKITKDAQKKNERIIVLRKNKPVFELRPLSDEASLIESFRKDIEEAQGQARRGEVYTQEEILKEFGL
ncbi:MAG TPA: type II toxin-antitoxin system Phd/YefM family antitoxin [Candidatus Yonathbacteria bacterium]|nr:type II toxin-antitoxin system Phd/YefM family antitoxin [Candidatus Yonathbacteria bacterium]